MLIVKRFLKIKLFKKDIPGKAENSGAHYNEEEDPDE